jgi:DNA-binding transcriptional MocR family regulator
VSHILQTLVLRLWSDPAIQAQIVSAGAVYAERREALLASLARHGVQARGASGLNVWVPVEDEATAVGALMQRGWVVASGAPYRLAGSEPGVRVTTATLTAEEAARLALDLAEVLAPTGFSRSG